MTLDSRALYALFELGESDCETIGSGLLNQPVNALSSAAYTLFGLWLIVRSVRNRSPETPVEIAYGAALASIGIGSIAFHGIVPPGARLMHDLTIAAALAVIAARSVGTRREWTARQVLVAAGTIVVVVGIVMAIAPDAGNLLTAGVGAAAVVGEALLYRTGRRSFSTRVAKILAATAGLLIVAAVVNVLGRTNGPLCDPESVLQGHAVWHVLTAAVFTLYAYVAFPHSAPDVASGHGSDDPPQPS